MEVQDDMYKKSVSQKLSNYSEIIILGIVYCFMRAYVRKLDGLEGGMEYLHAEGN